MASFKAKFQYFRSYLRKTTGGGAFGPPGGARVNPRPDTVFRHLRSDRGSATPPPLGVSKRSVVELSGKDQQIALAEYSRLVVLFWS